MKILLALLFISTNVFAGIPIKNINYDYAISVDGLISSVRSDIKKARAKYVNKKLLISGFSHGVSNSGVPNLYFLLIGTQYVYTDQILAQVVEKDQTKMLECKYGQRVVVLCTFYAYPCGLIALADCSIVK